MCPGFWVHITFSCGFFIALFNSIRYVILERKFSLTYFINEIVKIIVVQRRYTTLWFLAALFCGICIFHIINLLCKNDIQLLIVTVSISIVFIMYDTFVMVPLPWNLDTGFIMQIFFYLDIYAENIILFQN